MPFHTVKDNQTEIEIKTYYGENDEAAKNRLISSFILKGLPPKPAGEVLVNVRMRVTNDRLIVTAINEETDISMEAIYYGYY